MRSVLGEAVLGGDDLDGGADARVRSQRRELNGAISSAHLGWGAI